MIGVEQARNYHLSPLNLSKNTADGFKFQQSPTSTLPKETPPSN
jgi:hypothetical protein